MLVEHHAVALSLRNCKPTSTDGELFTSFIFESFMMEMEREVAETERSKPH